jgi:hypothetical protein
MQTLSITGRLIACQAEPQGDLNTACIFTAAIDTPGAANSFVAITGLGQDHADALTPFIGQEIVFRIGAAA